MIKKYCNFCGTDKDIAYNNRELDIDICLDCYKIYMRLKNNKKEDDYLSHLPSNNGGNV